MQIKLEARSHSNNSFSALRGHTKFQTARSRVNPSYQRKPTARRAVSKFAHACDRTEPARADVQSV
ncbi:MAG: hypothetical protein EAZ30_00375 [Betaproteobacteria bacterium]|nr:MAG: hypothetical protein EAZ30_00375 [Betaproteobacteria bacterium]